MYELNLYQLTAHRKSFSAAPALDIRFAVSQARNYWALILSNLPFFKKHLICRIVVLRHISHVCE